MCNILLCILHSIETQWYPIQWDLYFLRIRLWLMLTTHIILNTDQTARHTETSPSVCLKVSEKCLPFRSFCEESWNCQQRAADAASENKVQLDVGGLRHKVNSSQSSHLTHLLSRAPDSLSPLWLTGDGVKRIQARSNHRRARCLENYKVEP